MRTAEPVKDMTTNLGGLRVSSCLAVQRWIVVGIVVAAVVVLVGAVVVALIARRRARTAAGPAPAAGPVPGAGPPSLGRRRLLEQGIVVAFAGALAGVVAAAVDYVWPSVSGRTGGRYLLGTPGQEAARLAAAGRPAYDAPGRFYLAPYPAGDLPAARQAYPADEVAAMELGVVALSPRCPHLGCGVKWCSSSGWFECPCHGSQFNAVGELQRGPSPRGLDRHPIQVVGGRLQVDTDVTYPGPPPGTASSHQPPRGPHCYS